MTLFLAMDDVIEVCARTIALATRIESAAAGQVRRISQPSFSQRLIAREYRANAP